jgi:hypothetical protein
MRVLQITPRQTSSHRCLSSGAYYTSTPFLLTDDVVEVHDSCRLTTNPAVVVDALCQLRACLTTPDRLRVHVVCAPLSQVRNVACAVGHPDRLAGRANQAMVFFCSTIRYTSSSKSCTPATIDASSATYHPARTSATTRAPEHARC